MASSSSSAPSSRPAKKYDVFISFRGEDTRFNFTSHLHDALRRDKIETYIDYRLEKGDEIWPSLEKAIEDSTLFLVIFSENYASSTWCLKELTKILERSKNQGHNSVMPVFYRVDPSNVRKQSGSYEKAFEEHDHKGISKRQLQKWREALTYASNLGGWTCSLDRKEAELIKKIVKLVMQRLGCMFESEGHLKGLIGINKKIEDVESLLYKGSQDDVQFIGIWGMGGIGKTTLARAIFDKLRFAYEGFCFLSNVREESKNLGIDALKKKLVWTLLRDKESRIGDEEITPHAMWRLSQKKILIVLDDVDDHEQLESLAGRHDWFQSGSKILITTRDKQVFGKEVDDIYVLEALNFGEAFNLFSMNVFGKDCADPMLRELAIKVTRHAHGNPLALKVLGRFLFKKSHEEWESQLKKLKKFTRPEIHNVLMLSFSGLDHEERNIFLHVACFFKGYDVEEVKILLDSCDYSTSIGLANLEGKALINISKGRIYMHDLLQEMGREIVRKESEDDPQKRSRLWNSHEIYQILSQNMGSEAIEALSFNYSEINEEMYLSPQAFCRMPNLKFLDFQGHFHQGFNHDGIEFLPNELRLVRWHWCPLNSLPVAKNLVTIEMSWSKLTKLWDGVQAPVNLRKINLSYSYNLIELPNFSRCIHLTDVNLQGCFKLQSVNPSILSLHSLHRLSLEECESLTSLTSSTHLESLGYLSLSGCSSLEKFSVTSKNCEFELNLAATAINDEMFSSSGHLSKMHTLCLNRCASLANLPYKLADLRNLRKLQIMGCNKLASNLHFIFDGSRALEAVEVDDCSGLFELPDNIYLLASLRKLHLSSTNVKTLPVSIKHLLRLQRLELDDCKRLRSLPELPPSIRWLIASDCRSLKTVHLTSTIDDHQVEEGDEDAFICFNFTNCMKLDRDSIKSIEAKVLLEMNKATPIPNVSLAYPGNKLPEWFMYRTKQSSIVLDFSSIPQPWDGSFIFCAIVSKSLHFDEIKADCYIDRLHIGHATFSYTDELHGSFSYTAELFSDHVIFWKGSVETTIGERKTDTQSRTCHPLLEIKFRLIFDGEEYEDKSMEVKEYGVCPMSAPECQNYIQQMKLALRPQPNSIELDFSCSYYRTSHSTMHDELHKVVIGACCSRKRKYDNIDLEEFEDLDSD